MKKKIVFALLMGIVTTGIVSFTLISLNTGYVARFLGVWLKSWLIAYIVAIPAIIFVSPVVQKLVDKYIR